MILCLYSSSYWSRS